ncbi:prepilin-type N-terminal cleavage/methylation domain-containing protein, partial [Klebsiella pneumoniae]
MSQRGFTLLEMMLVLLLIGVSASMVNPKRTPHIGDVVLAIGNP